MVGKYLILNICIFVGSEGFIVPDGLNTVSAPAGDIVGFLSSVELYSKRYTIREYLGIPYAEPPTGDRRFAKPVPKAKFSTPFNATRNGPACYQIDSVLPKPLVNTVSEDCLVLNIYAPDSVKGNEEHVYSVMVFVHGGGFVIGMSNTYNGQHLSAFGDVIVVTINYRLAEFGFLSTGDSAIPGNAGLWDQHLAIKWVHDNIQAFGGDTTRVTVFGESAGSISAVYQALYPGNKGLFQRVIAESGSITSAGINRKIADAQNFAGNFSKLIGCHLNSSQDMVKCLRSKSGSEINKIMNSPEALVHITALAPVLDHDFVYDDAYAIINGQSLAKEAIHMFQSVDLIIGMNSKEGIIDHTLWMNLLNITDFQGVSKKGFDEILIPYYLNFYYNQAIPEIVQHATICEYTDWTDPKNDVRRANKMADLVNDAYFSVTSVLTANLHESNTNVSTYMYRFATRPLAHLQEVPDFMDGPGVANHVDELAFVFGVLQDFNTTLDARLEHVRKAVMTMWSNFAKTGNPNKPEDISIYTSPIWPQYGTDENYLEITPDMTLQSVKQRLAPRAVQFWNKLVPEILRLKCN